MTTLREVEVGSIVKIGKKTYRVTDIPAGISTTQLEQVAESGGKWVSARKLLCADPNDAGIYDNDTVVVKLEGL